MRRRVVAPGLERREPGDRRLAMAAQAEGVAVSDEAEAVRVVAARAAHPGAVHPALRERAPNVHLVADLPVREVEALAERAREEIVEEGPRVAVRVADRLPMRVAAGASLDLRARIPLAEIHDQPGRRGVDPGPGLPRARPLDVALAGPVAGLAADVDGVPDRAVRIAGGVVVLAQVGRVARRAHGVPGLVPPGPVQRVARRDALVRIEMEPLAPPRVPGDRQALEPPAGERREVLLERLGAEGVRQLEVARRPVRALRVDEEASLAREEPGRDAEAAEGRIPEVAEDRLRRGRLHGEVVVGPGPRAVLRRVARRAGCLVDVGDAARAGPAQLAGRGAGAARPAAAGGGRKQHQGRRDWQQAASRHAWRRTVRPAARGAPTPRRPDAAAPGHVPLPRRSAARPGS